MRKPIDLKVIHWNIRNPKNPKELKEAPRNISITKELQVSPTITMEPKELYFFLRKIRNPKDP